jgi:DNA-directed RNA polymerase subunit D
MIKIAKKSDEKIEFTTDMPISLANAIRRSINEIPILAIDSLEITKNDSALYDEIISHRMGLIPLKNEDLKLPDECTCKGKGCGKCMIKFKLKAKGPAMVYSSDLSPKGNVIYKMPITLLDKNQELEFVAVAKMGKGIEHAKFTPGLFYYRYVDDVESGEKDESFKKLVEEAKKDENKELLVCIESWGQIKAKDIFIKSIDALNKNLKELTKAVK